MWDYTMICIGHWQCYCVHVVLVIIIWVLRLYLDEMGNGAGPRLELELEVVEATKENNTKRASTRYFSVTKQIEIAPESWMWGKNKPTTILDYCCHFPALVHLGDWAIAFLVPGWWSSQLLTNCSSLVVSLIIKQRELSCCCWLN